MTCLALVLSHGFHTFVEDDRALLLDQVVNNKMEEYEMNKIY